MRASAKGGVPAQLLMLFFPPLGLAWDLLRHRRRWALLGFIGVMALWLLGVGVTSAITSAVIRG